MRKRNPRECRLTLIHYPLTLPIHADAIQRPAQVTDINTFVGSV